MLLWCRCIGRFSVERRAAFRLRACFVVLSLSAGLRAQPTVLPFVGVALDAETQKADERLRDYLRAKLGVRFEPRELEYGAAVDALAHWDATKGPVLARVTPYVYLVAEMLGADLDILGTYVSKGTGETTYHSYFVLRRDAGLASDDVEDFPKYLRNRTAPARFVYHNKFSTSSYLLPLLYFRRAGVFSTKTRANESKRILIHADKPVGAEASGDLVRMVKQREADFAAVWDGTQNKFAQDPDLVFLKLPNALPNDLLVFISATDRSLRDRIQASLRGMKDTDINSGDFLRWQDFNATPDARRALAALRWLTRAPPAPMPIVIRQAHGDAAELDGTILEAAKQAVRLSSTEFTLYDEDYHQHFDVLWTLKKVHDDSLVLTSEFVDFKVPAQQFHVSFKKGDKESLVSRIEETIAGGMHRVRDVWSFADDIPTVLRDVRFNLPVGSQTKAVKITWNDFTNNDRVVGAPFDATVAASDFHAFKFKSDGFPKRNDGLHFDFDPLSNTAYRVILIRPSQETRLLRVGTYALMTFFFLAAGSAFWALVRAPR